ncbi:MAG: polysaccharide biosynthesis/export family protein [Verrucomicrobiota bacterium]
MRQGFEFRQPRRAGETWPVRLAFCFLSAGFLLLGLTGCQGPFAHSGPRFDARQPAATAATAATNLVPVELTNRLSADWLKPSSDAFTLGPGDRIEVEILSDSSAHATLTVGPDGKIYFFLLPGLDVWGLTLSQTRELLERELAQYIAGAQVSVTLRGIESKRVWLLGRFRNAGVYPVGAPLTLLESISAAGGIQSSTALTGSGEAADLSHSFVVRSGTMIPVDFDRLITAGDMTQNIYLRADDFVYIPTAASKELYVLGAVRLPKPVPATAATTLISAIATAGGTIKDAYLSQIGIVRGSLSQPKLAVVNYRDIVAGRASDVRLEPQDIVYVPLSPYRNLVKYVDLILATFVRAVAINEGARAVSDDVPPVGVNIGIGTIR